MNAQQTTLAAPPGSITVEQWGAMEAPPFYELVNGYLQAKPEVSLWHDFLLFDLAALLTLHVKERRLGQLVGASCHHCPW